MTEKKLFVCAYNQCMAEAVIHGSRIMLISSDQQFFVYQHIRDDEEVVTGQRVDSGKCCSI